MEALRLALLLRHRIPCVGSYAKADTQWGTVTVVVLDVVLWVIYGCFAPHLEQKVAEDASWVPQVGQNFIPG